MNTNQDYFIGAKNATKTFVDLSETFIAEVLRALADKCIIETDTILQENLKDLALMDQTDPKYDRLALNAERIEAIATDIKNVAKLKSPLGEVLSDEVLANGLNIKKVRVPLGVVGVIYEARPNVTLDVFSLCFKTGNVVILKGGSDAENSNNAIVSIIKSVLAQYQINTDVVTLLPSDRTATQDLLAARNYVDVLIPRGSQGLIDFVRENSKVPVIETGAGIVHTYADETADLDKLSAIVLNSKTRRPSVCNTLDCLIINEKLLSALSAVLKPLADKTVVIYADDKSHQALEDKYPANLLQVAEESHFGTEFLSLKMAVKTVANIDEALNHIALYSSKHSEAIVSENATNIEKFLNSVDAAAVYANASTAFTDGAQFGLGAEIGISTQKLHARGPMGLAELTSYKWVVKGNGQVRN